jgi:ABC-type transport system substrate-binding protein
MNNKVAPFDNLQVRQAVSLALDRPAFDQAYDGLCAPLGQAFAPGLVGYVDSLTPKTDIAQAKSLIASAGANGAKVKVLSINVQPYIAFAQVLQAQLDNIGLNVQIMTLAAGGTFRLLYQQGGYGMLLAPTSIQAPDPSQVVDQYVLGIGNPGTKDPTLVAKIHQAEQLPVGSSQRAAAFQDVNRYLTTTALLWAPICQGINIMIGNKKVIGLNAMPNAALSVDATASYLQIAK